MNIVERTIEAVKIYNTLTMCRSQAQPNVMYMGYAEFHEVHMDHCHSLSYRAGDVYFMGMRIVAVSLESWLQVTYVEGAK